MASVPYLHEQPVTCCQSRIYDRLIELNTRWTRGAAQGKTLLTRR